MSLYDNLKYIALTLKGERNRVLFEQLIDLSAQALDLQNEVSRLKAEITELKQSSEIKEKIERHQEPYITLRNDTGRTIYCSRCWDYEKKLVQIKRFDTGSFRCTHCDNTGVYDEERKNNNKPRSATKKVFVFIK